MDAIDEIYEKRQPIVQAEERLEEMLKELRALEPLDVSKNLQTPVQEETDEQKTPRKRLCKWATEGKGDIMYEFLFKFVTGKTYVGVREHFMSLAKQAEMDLVIMQIMCIFHKRKNIERFRDMIYCVPPQFMYHMLQKYQHKYFDPETRRPYELSTFKDNDVEYPGSNDRVFWGETMFSGPITTPDELVEYREDIVEYILLHNDNSYRSKAVQASEPKQRSSRPSRHLQSPYVQLNSLDLESGNAKHKRK
ncbi:hypothetical protein PIB30_035348 [Stylosanthes scabra]|uniref:Uncharacterized protein n=1 Tax=Stylosanthes scabra TaxID=79078 RepID=A0ABU6VB35_9FABA|nr:hypothetical protein [Stylosanthes scabra]